MYMMVFQDKRADAVRRTHAPGDVNKDGVVKGKGLQVIPTAMLWRHRGGTVQPKTTPVTDSVLSL